ncbi:MAG: pilus assembly protein TadG-related protein [Myxococcota bacterium]
MRRRNRATRGERGQVALLGVVALVVLAIGMYTSYNFARAVYEKIALQNAADASAYSLATQSARSFNFIAFSNRAMAARQLELLELHAEVSQTTYSIGVIGYMGDVTSAYAKYLQANPTTAPVGAALELVGSALEATYEARRIELDGRIRALEIALGSEPAFSALYTAMAAGLVASTTARLVEGAPDIAEANDPDARLHPLSYGFNAYNVYAYVDAIDPGGLQRTPESQRAFAEVINASRIAAGSRSKKIVWRNGILDEISAPLEILDNASQSEDVVKANRRMSESIGSLSSGFPATEFEGTSKLLTRIGERDVLDDTGRSADESSFLSRGQVMTSKDVRSGFATLPALALAAEEGFASLQSGPDGFRYCRYSKPEQYGSPGLGGARLYALLADPKLAGFGCVTETSPDFGRRLQWRGLGRYFRFKSKGDKRGARAYNQPDVWVFLNKPPEAMGGADDLNFEIRRGSEVAAIDARIGEAGVLGSGELAGVNAIARAQVYYHRPGAWREPPNLFNPYWGARLAPKNVVTDELLDRLGLSGAVADFFSDNAMMF